VIAEAGSWPSRQLTAEADEHGTCLRGRSRAQRRRRELGSASRKRSESFRSVGPEAGVSRLEARPRVEVRRVVAAAAVRVGRDSMALWDTMGPPQVCIILDYVKPKAKRRADQGAVG